MVIPGSLTSQKKTPKRGSPAGTQGQGPWKAVNPTAQMNREDQAHNLPVLLMADGGPRGDAAEEA